MEEMPKETKFLLQFVSNIYGTQYECEPDNWSEVELGLSRKMAVNKEITSEFIFSGTAGKIIKLIYDTYGYLGTLTMVMSKRQNDWSYSVFHTFTADFRTFMWDNKAHITFKENITQKQIDDNMGIDYTFTMPTTTQLNYSGVNTIRNNTIKVIPAVLNASTSTTRVIKGARTISNSSLYYDFSPKIYNVLGNYVGSWNDYYAIQTIRAKTSTYNVRLGTLTIEVEGRLLTSWSRIELRKMTPNGTITYIKVWTSISTLYNEDTDTSTVLFSDGATYSYDVATNAGDMIYLTFHDTDITDLTCTVIEGTTTLSILSDEESPYQEVYMNAVTHQWLLAKILDKINPDLILSYNLPDNTDTVSTLLVPSSSLRGQGVQEITCSLEKVLKSLKCLYGADYRLSGETFTIDYADSFFTNSKAIDVVPIDEIKISYSPEHVYNKVVVGYDTDDDIVNGEFEFNCKNTFTLNTSSSQELDLIHPFKGSMYTVEQYLRDKSDDNKTDNKDTDIFIFAVGTYTSTATLYRDFTSSDIPATAFNVPISPMRMLIANARYLGVSMYKGTPQAVFQSTDRKANITTICAYESDIIEEDNGTSSTPLGIAMASPLFLPETIEFTTGIKLWNMTTINDNLYKYFEITDLKTNLTHRFYIGDISLRLTRINSQNWIGWTANS